MSSSHWQRVFVGRMDAATSLLYVGNGQYYDPETGRFLTRDANPNQTDLYLPWDAMEQLLGPKASNLLWYKPSK